MTNKNQISGIHHVTAICSNPQKNIDFYSLCEHHMLPFIGRAHVAYIPSGKVLGLSKIPRIVDMYARRLQIQENLTKEIADSIMQITGASGYGATDPETRIQL